jgi:ferric-dicitrate binding protein FerR (iron transport regulator)
MKEESNHIIPYELFIKYLNNELNKDEELTLMSWLKADSDHPGILDEYKRTWDLMDKIRDVSTVNLDKEWAKQKNEIYLKEGAEIDTVQIQETSSKWDFLKLAAVITVLILASVTIYYILPRFSQEKIASNTEVRFVTLPDGSEVTLNLNSRIKYPTTFGWNERIVHIEGEAFFDVVRNPGAPFRINTNKVIIEVLGTSFNVNAYNTDEQVEVIVTDGTVALSSIENPDNKIILDKGTKGIYDPSNNNLVKKTNSDKNFLSWKTRTIIFSNDSLSLVLKTLDKVYGHNIILKDKDLGNCTLTAAFENQSLESVLNVIESTLNLDIKWDNETIIVSGEGC